MPNGLVNFFQDRIKNIHSESKWNTELKRFYSAETYDHESLTFIVNDCLDYRIDHPQDFLACLHKILSALLLLHCLKVEDKGLYRILQTALEAALKQGYWNDFQLGSALASLACHLLNLPADEVIPKLLPSGAALVEHGGHRLDAHLPNPILNAELGIIWALLGVVNKNYDQILSALQLGHWQLNTVDYNGVPFEGLWLKGDEYCPISLLSANYLLFDMCQALSEHPKMQLARDNQLRQLAVFKEDDFYESPMLTLLLSEYLEEKLSSYELSDTLKSNIGSIGISREDKDLGFCHYCYNDFNLICSASGSNTGIGSIHKDQVHITNMGPHFYPLGNLEGFGIYRTCVKDGSFKDIMIKIDDGMLDFKGWARLISPELSTHGCSKVKPGNSWMEFHMEGLETKCKLTVKCLQNESAPLAFTFFIKAEQALVDQKFELLPKSLDRYSDQTTSMTFKRGNSSLTIHPSYEGKMEVIPLAGKNHFWGADFLLAFPISPDQKRFSWEIE